MKPRAKTPADSRRRPPAKTPEARENQMIAMAMDHAERQLRDGTASAQVTVHFLKLGTMRAQMETEAQRLQNELTKAKTENLQSQKRSEELYLNAMRAFGTYRGERRPDEDDDA